MLVKCFGLACLFGSFLASSAQASTIGNGGKVFIRWTNMSHFEDAKLVDFFEGESLSDVTPNFSDIQGSGDFDSSDVCSLNGRDQVASKAFLRLQRLDPALAKQFSERAISMIAESAFLRDIVLTNIDDVMNTEAPVDYVLAQAAVHRSDVMPGQKAFIFDMKHWCALNPTDKTGLLMHEVIYEYFVTLGETNSAHARYLNYMIASDAISKWSVRDLIYFYERLDNAHDAEFVRWNGETLKRASIEFYPSGAIKSAEDYSGEEFKFNENCNSPYGC